MLKPFIFMFISSLAGAFIATSMKALSFHLSIAVIFFFTRVFILLGAIPTLFKHRALLWQSQNKVIISLVSFFYIAGMYCYFYSLLQIPMSISSLFVNSAPLYVPFLAYFILKDHSVKSKKLWIAIAISFIGVIFILLPQGKVDYSALGIGLAFVSGIFLALWQVLTKRTTANEMPERIAFFQMLVSIFITFFPALFIVSSHGVHYLDTLWTFKNISMLMLAGISSWVYQLYRTKAMTHAPVSYVMPLSYLGVIFVGVLDWIFWGVIPHASSVMGMALVAIGVIFLLRAK